MRRIVLGLGGLLALGSAGPVQAALSKTLVTSGLSSPLFVTAPASDSSRLFIVERAGRIEVFVGDSLNPTSFLNIVGKTLSGDERGLLGLAFDPDYDQNGYFYVNYTARTDGRTRISRFTVSPGNPEVADTAETVLLEILQFADNHNGGMIAFGPDGYLYIGMGDGGSSGDPGNRAQNPDSLLGKMLRIDVSTVPYSIPPDNPFVVPDTARHEIWAFGLRNPWRWSFDRLTGDMYIADVGQSVREEISFQPASSPGGENYGWRRKEGFSCFNPASNCDPLGQLTDPITQYLQTDRCSITGGYVYRGCVAPEAYGHYFYGDYCTGEVWSFRYDGLAISDSTDHTAELGMDDFDLASFGEDAQGELYLVGIGTGTVWRVVSDAPSDSCAVACPIDIMGDVDTSGTVTSADIIYMVNHVFKEGAAPLPVPEAGDVNCSSTLTAADVIFLVNFVFKGGGPPCDACVLL